MERTVRTFSSFEEAEEADRRYYAGLTPDQRLEILGELLQRGRADKHDATERLARVFRIVQFPRR